MDEKRWSLADYFGERTARKLWSTMTLRIRLRLQSCLRQGKGASFGLAAVAGETLHFPEEEMALESVQAWLTLGKPIASAPQPRTSNAQLLIELCVTVRPQRVIAEHTQLLTPLALRACFNGDLWNGIETFLLGTLVREGETLAGSVQPQKEWGIPLVPLACGLVPALDEEALDTLAQTMLQLFYPEALERPQRLNPHELAARMDIAILPHRIAANRQIYGEIFFESMQTSLYNDMRKVYFNHWIRRKTMVVDATASYMGDTGTYDSTIVHECVHWLLHRAAMLLKKPHEDNAPRGFCCQVDGSVAGNTDAQILAMEAQANALVPRLQMPLGPFQQKANELFTRYGYSEKWRPERVDAMPSLIDALAGFYGVSRTAAKLRLIDAGYEDARGACVHIDGRDLPPHSWSPGTLGPNDTFSIPAADAARLLLEDEDFARAARGYIYLDGHFVLNHPHYVERSRHDGSWQLTEAARHHMDECCLVFTLSLQDADTPMPRYERRCLFSQSAGLAPYTIHYFYDEQLSEEESDRRHRLMREEEYSIFAQISANPRESLKHLINWRKTNQTQLSEITSLSTKTINNVANNKTTPDLATALCVCFGLQLPPLLSEFMLNYWGHGLSIHNESHRCYLYVLENLYTREMDFIRRYLKDECNFPL